MLLEVIALSAADAAAAAEGGADRLEVVADMAADGLTPAPDTVAAIRAACPLPLRVMLRREAGFAAGPATLRELRAAAEEFDAILGPDDGFVYGFLRGDGSVDAEAVAALHAAAPDRPWTFHRAVDHAVDYAAAWAAVSGLPGADQVLTAGSPAGVADGLPRLAAYAHPGTAVVGGGLRLGHLPELAAMGVRAFHIGGAARPGWDAPVAADRVRTWRDALAALA